MEINPAGEEIFAYGLRNPWKFSFDEESGRAWLGDVGQFRYEEINILESGKNYGWNKMEGMHCYPDTTLCDTAGRGFTLPIWEYTHEDVLQPYAVVCGSVYRENYFLSSQVNYCMWIFLQGKFQALTYDSINGASNEILLDTNLYFTSIDLDQNREPLMVEYSASNGRLFRLKYSGPLELDLKIIIEGYFNESENILNKKDTVTAYLHNSVYPYQKMDSSKAVIDSTDFSGRFLFYNVPGGNYYKDKS
ncbi:MAG: PQQ-dependent sugar dehydrogenase [Ignavibacteria bacterium]